MELDKLIPGSSFIFKAKVLLLHTNTTNEQDVSNSGVVLLNEVIEAPESLKNIVGEQITVRFNDINKVNVGDEKMFFTEPYWLGEAIGVNEKGSIIKGNKLYDNKEISLLIQKAKNKQENVQLKSRLDESNLVIMGKVIKIDIPSRNTIIGTEHDPEWKEAEIQIDETLKGKSESKTLKILFASGKDIMFFQAPKLNLGDEGIFIIQPTDSQTLKIISNKNMLIEPENFIKGKENLNHIKSLIRK